MQIKNKGYVIPVAIGVLVVASLGLLMWSWLSTGSDKKAVDENNNPAASSTLSAKWNQPNINDDASIDEDSASIDAQIKALDKANADVETGLNDVSTI
jgi:hypothetical protein